MDLAEEIHLLSKSFPREELYGLTSQIRRAAVSVPSNIAEGHSRQSTAEFRNFGSYESEYVNALWHLDFYHGRQNPGMDRLGQALPDRHVARDSIQSARFVTGIRDRLQRYITQDYPAQLALAAKLAASATQPPQKPGEKTPSPAPAIRYTSATSLRPECSLPYIATEADLDQWLAALRMAAQAELEKGNRISL
jgi:hypothetical protein